MFNNRMEVYLRFFKIQLLFIGIFISSTLFFTCQDNCTENITCGQKNDYFKGYWTIMNFINVYEGNQIKFENKFISEINFEQQEGWAYHYRGIDSICFAWKLNCLKDSITITVDFLCGGIRGILTADDTYFIEEYSPLEIKWLKEFETQDSGKIQKHINRYILLK